MQKTIKSEFPKEDGIADNARRAPRLGIIGGGQLARMTAMAALKLGCDVAVLERNPRSPASSLARTSLVGDWDNPEDLIRLAAHADVVTLENEFVDARGLAALEAAGCKVFPTAGSLALVQDKLIQKQVLVDAGLPVPRFRATDTLEEVRAAAFEFGLPVILKARRNAYDGKGNVLVQTAEGIRDAWEKLGGERGVQLYVEAYCPFVKELALIITCGRSGETAAYPVVETVQHNHICHIVRAPAALDTSVTKRAETLAREALIAVDAVGSFGVELFLTADNRILINELAPRVHNSGHYTLDACVCSQFENHVRAVMGWPLGSSSMIAPAAVMVNLLGTGPGSGWPSNLAPALSIPGIHLHLYGKARSSPGRKMGHITAVHRLPERAEELALLGAKTIKFGDPYEEETRA